MAIEYIKRRILAEKVGYQNANKYVFEVDNFLTKAQIKKCLLELFKLEPNSIVSVNTHRPPQKHKRRMSNIGKKTIFKRAIITVKQGQNLSFSDFS